MVSLPLTYHNQPHAIVHEAGHRVYHDGTWKYHHVATTDGVHGSYATYVQDKAKYDTSKLATWHNKVVNDAGYTYTRLHEVAIDRRENAVVDYHHYPTTTSY
ncbi:hypothetical protein ACQ4PT_042220 [Festuca glaucescens]